MQTSTSTPGAKRCCAYCNATSDLTREHVLPAFIETREVDLGRGKSITNVKADGQEKSVQTEVTIADVCGTCNNGVLSKLDNYAARLYDQFFAIYPRPGKEIRFAFDFDMLLRWLLKLAYNAGRTRGWSPSLLRPLRDAVPYIKGETGRPASVKLFLQLIVAARLSSEEKRRGEQQPGQHMAEIPPNFRRIMVFALRGMIGYRIAMNGYYFYVLFRNPKSTAAEHRTLEKHFYAEVKGAKSLDPNTATTIIYPSSVSILDFAKNERFLQSSIAAATQWVEARKKQGKRPERSNQG